MMCSTVISYVSFVVMRSFTPNSDGVRACSIHMIYKEYLVPSFLFALSIDSSLFLDHLSKDASNSLRKIRNWLASALHYPNLIDISALLELRTKAKLTFVTSVTSPKDPTIQEILSIVVDNSFVHSQEVPSVALELLEKAKSSMDSIATKSLKAHCKR